MLKYLLLLLIPLALFGCGRAVNPPTERDLFMDCMFMASGRGASAVTPDGIIACENWAKKQ